MNPHEGSTFKGFNTSLLVPQRRGGYKPGTIGVSQFQGRVLNYNRPGSNPLQGGAGVSTMTRVPGQSSLMNPETYSLYKREPSGAVQGFGNLYK
jgi:hypothetical protein